jgi:hypothetical protein
MNERIKELALECYSPYTNFDHEKFAVLIIRECAGLMDGRRIEYGNCKDGRVILKHFGVEE